jgi:hypothetical protein
MKKIILLISLLVLLLSMNFIYSAVTSPQRGLVANEANENRTSAHTAANSDHRDCGVYHRKTYE